MARETPNTAAMSGATFATPSLRDKHEVSFPPNYFIVFWVLLRTGGIIERGNEGFPVNGKKMISKIKTAINNILQIIKTENGCESDLKLDSDYLKYENGCTLLRRVVTKFSAQAYQKSYIFNVAFEIFAKHCNQHLVVEGRTKKDTKDKTEAYRLHKLFQGQYWYWKSVTHPESETNGLGEKSRNTLSNTWLEFHALDNNVAFPEDWDSLWGKQQNPRQILVRPAVDGCPKQVPPNQQPPVRDQQATFDRPSSTDKLQLKQPPQLVWGGLGNQPQQNYQIVQAKKQPSLPFQHQLQEQEHQQVITANQQLYHQHIQETFSKARPQTNYPHQARDTALGCSTRERDITGLHDGARSGTNVSQHKQARSEMQISKKPPPGKCVAGESTSSCPVY